MTQENSTTPPFPPEAPPHPANQPSHSPSVTASPPPLAPTVFEQWLIADLKAKKWERRRRWLRYALLSLLLVSTIVAISDQGESKPSQKHIAQLKLKGEVGEDRGIDADATIKALRHIFENEYVSAVILDINSPGGSPVQSDLIYQEIMALRQQYPDKKVVAVAADLCASGGYYIAAAAHEIYVNASSIVGSIGVIAGGFGYPELMKKLGVERRVITAGVNKALNDPFQPINPERQAILQAIVNNSHLEFIAAVRNGRGKRLIEDKDTFSGAAWSGREAVKRGLADGIGSVKTVSNNLGKDLEVIDYSESPGLFERIIGDLGASIGNGISQGIASKVNASPNLLPLR